MLDLKASWYADQFKGRRHVQVFSTFQEMRTQQTERLRHLEIYKMMYSDKVANGYVSSIRNTASAVRNGNPRFSENLIRSVIDTICAKIGKNSPKPFCVSNGGDGGLRRRAKGLNKYTMGKFDQLQVSEILRTILRDACVVGTGAGKIFIDEQTKDLCIERTMIEQLFVDQNEGQFASPTQLFQVIPANKEIMMACYPTQAVLLKNAAPPSYPNFINKRHHHGIVEQVEIVEAWKLPDIQGNPGRHVICASNCTLVDEEWDNPEFPFVWLHYSKPLEGFWGEGLAAMLMPIQYRINYMVNVISESIRLCGKPTWLVKKTANVASGHIQNVIGNILLYNDQPPTLASFQTVNPEVFQWLADQRNRAFELAGISQMSAESKRPTADVSGIALETMNDVESERFIMLGMQYEQASVHIAKKIIDITAAEYDSTDKDVRNELFKSNYSRSWEVTQVKWSDVNMKRDQYNLQVFPISTLPSTPAGRQQKITDLLQQGMIDKDTARELLDFPDYQRWADLKAAGEDNAERLVEEVLYDGKDHVVEKYHNVTYMLQYAQNLYNQQQLIDADEEKLERLRQIMDQCQEFLDQAQAVQQPPMPAGPQQAAQVQQGATLQ